MYKLEICKLKQQLWPKSDRQTTVDKTNIKAESIKVDIVILGELAYIDTCGKINKEKA